MELKCYSSNHLTTDLIYTELILLGLTAPIPMLQVTLSPIFDLGGQHWSIMAYDKDVAALVSSPL